ELDAEVKAARIAERGGDMEPAGGVADVADGIPAVRVPVEREGRADRGAGPQPPAYQRGGRRVARHPALRLDPDVQAQQPAPLPAHETTDRGGVTIVPQIAQRRHVHPQLDGAERREVDPAVVAPDASPGARRRYEGIRQALHRHGVARARPVLAREARAEAEARGKQPHAAPPPHEPQYVIESERIARR